MRGKLQNKKWSINPLKWNWSAFVKPFVTIFNVIVDSFDLIFRYFRNNRWLSTSNLPASVDWRTKGAVTPVKDQRTCGSCWAFSAIGALESLSFIAGKDLIEFSEQQLVDCAGGYKNNGCDGGHSSGAFGYVRDHGIRLESSYPYLDTQSSCHEQCPSFRISGYSYVPPDDDAQLRAAIALQPVSVGITATSVFHQYKSGVIQNCGGGDINHAVLAVGYTSEYWIIKNSWGWSGENGYYRLARGNTCKILLEASYPHL